MKTDFVFLQRLDDDLREAAVREITSNEDSRSQVAGRSSDTRSTRPSVADLASRHLPRRERRWRGLVAAGVSLLVVAGGIGFFVQNTGVGTRAAREPGSVVGIGKGDGASAAPVPAPPGLGQSGLPATDSRAGGSGTRAEVVTGKAAEVPAATPVPAAQGGSGARDSYLSAAPRTDLSKIVRDGSIGLEVGNGTFGKAVARLTGIAVANHGMVLSSSTKNENSGMFTLRIPASRFDRAMLQLRGIAKVTDGRVLSDTRTGQDVTAQYIDLKARLALLKDRRALLVSLQDKATSVGGILAIANKVDQVQLQIEQIQGQLNVINDQVAESTIKASIREKDAASTAVPPPSESRLASAWRTAVDGFLNVVGAVIVGLGYLLPIAALALLGFGIFTLVRRRRPGAS